MSRTAKLRKQHDELAVLAGAIGEASAGLDDPAAGERLHGLLRQFDAVLTEHLATEDRILYPEMLAASDRRTAALASRFCEEMGRLTTDYAAFAARWNAPAALLADPGTFRRDWAVLRDALAFRMQRENAELYPLADAQGDPPPVEVN